MEDLERSFGSSEVCSEVGCATCGCVRVRGVRYYNYSGRCFEEIRHFLPADFHAEKVVMMPDFSPSRGLLPTGCSVEFDVLKQPSWRKFAVSDIGCGIQLLKSGICWEEFDGRRGSWVRVLECIKRHEGGLGDLGSGNHFVDAASDMDGRVYFAIHTGSSDESEKAGHLVDIPEKFDDEYRNIMVWARDNRDAIADILRDYYGQLDMVLDKPHNFFCQLGSRVVIYKGTIELRPGELSLIPSSMDGDMVVVEALKDLSCINYTVAHGTGRMKSRSESKADMRSYDFAGLRRRLHIPGCISDTALAGEYPSVYRNIDDCLAIIRGLVNVKERLTPIAYIGQV